MSAKNKVILSIVGVILVIAVGVLYWLDRTGKISIFADTASANVNYSVSGDYQIVFSPEAIVGQKWQTLVFSKTKPATTDADPVVISIPFNYSTQSQGKGWHFSKPWQLSPNDITKTKYASDGKTWNGGCKYPDTTVSPQTWNYILCKSDAFELTSGGYYKLTLDFNVPSDEVVGAHTFSGTFHAPGMPASKSFVSTSPSINIRGANLGSVDPTNDRINVVFYGANYSDSTAFYNSLSKLISSLTSENSFFMTNKIKYWYDEITRSFDASYFSTLTNRNFELCRDLAFETNISLPNKINVFFCKDILRGSVVDNGKDAGSVTAFEGGPIYLSDTDTSQWAAQNNPKRFSHGFGHAFGWIENGGLGVMGSEDMFSVPGDYFDKTTLMESLIKNFTNASIKPQKTYSLTLYNNSGTITNSSIVAVDKINFTDEKNQPTDGYKVSLVNSTGADLYKTNFKFPVPIESLSSVKNTKKDILLPDKTGAISVKVFDSQGKLLLTIPIPTSTISSAPVKQSAKKSTSTTNSRVSPVK